MAAPPSVPVDGQLTVWWVPTIAGMAATPVTGPTVTEIAAGVDITCYLVESKAGVSKTQNTVTDRRMCNTTATTIPGAAEATADDITYIYDPQAASSAPNNEAFDELAEGDKGYFVVRRGEAYDPDATSGDQVEVQECTLGVRWDSSNPTEDFSKMTQTRFLHNFVEKIAVTT